MYSTKLPFASQTNHACVWYRHKHVVLDCTPTKCRSYCIAVFTGTYAGATPLLAAADQGHVEVVRMLLAVPGIQVNYANGRGDTALMLAASSGHADVARTLVGIFVDLLPMSLV